MTKTSCCIYFPKMTKHDKQNDNPKLKRQKKQNMTNKMQTKIETTKKEQTMKKT